MNHAANPAANPAKPTEPHPITEGLTAAFRLLKWGGVLIVLGVFASGVSVVRQDEVALRLRFGRLTGATAAEQVHGPGLLLSLPYLIDTVVRVQVRRVLEMNIDALRSRSALAFKRVDITREGYALTGDHNLIQPAVRLKYQIVDPVAWALHHRNPGAEVHDAVVTALTRTLAEMRVDEVLVDGKRRLAANALRRAQARLDRPGGPWVLLLALEFTSLQPPAQVARFFDDVQKAFVEKKTEEEKARSYAEERIPLAEAERDRLANEARGIAAASTAAAAGEADAFTRLLTQYRANPQVVRERLWLEAVEQLIPSVGALNLVPPGFSAYHLLIPGRRPASTGAPSTPAGRMAAPAGLLPIPSERRR